MILAIFVEPISRVFIENSLNKLQYSYTCAIDWATADIILDIVYRRKLTHDGALIHFTQITF